MSESSQLQTFSKICFCMLLRDVHWFSRCGTNSCGANVPQWPVMRWDGSHVRCLWSATTLWKTRARRKAFRTDIQHMAEMNIIYDGIEEEHIIYTFSVSYIMPTCPHGHHAFGKVWMCAATCVLQATSSWPSLSWKTSWLPTWPTTLLHSQHRSEDNGKTNAHYTSLKMMRSLMISKHVFVDDGL